MVDTGRETPYLVASFPSAPARGVGPKGNPEGRGPPLPPAVDPETGGAYENLPAVHPGRPESLHGHRLRAPHLGDQEPGWLHGLPPGGHRGASGVVGRRDRHPGPEILPQVRGAATRPGWEAPPGRGGTPRSGRRAGRPASLPSAGGRLDPLGAAPRLL